MYINLTVSKTKLCHLFPKGERKGRKEEENKKERRGASLVAQWLRICLLMQGTRVQSLVGELRSYMPPGASKNKERKKEKEKSHLSNLIQI